MSSAFANRLRHRAGAALLLAAAACGVAQPSSAEELTIVIDRGIKSAIPIAVVPFATVGDSIQTDVADVIRSDLTRSGQFTSLPVSQMPSQPATASAVNYKDWRVLGRDDIVIGKILSDGAGGYAIEYRVIDVVNGKQVLGFRIPTSAENMRLTAHYISDQIYEALTGRKGAFATRIAYVTVERKTKKDSLYRLQVADADGFDPHTILESPQPLMSPTWSPEGSRLAYVSFEDRNSAIYVQDIRTGKREKVVSGPGINSSPAFAPDGQRMTVTLSREGNPEIYIFSLASRTLTRLTNNPAIDTEAIWSPDGGTIYFTSDRGGGPQIYKMTQDGLNVQRVTFNMGSYNSRARISPDGKKLAVVHGGDGGYRIGVVDLTTSSFNLVTDASLDESPSFAPNGDMIIYATMGGRGTELAATSTDGQFRQRLALQRGEVREPAWGPFRK